ncbi:MAG: hypothetical protein ACI9U2_000959 [Bradymonadia bacterium]
MFPFADGLRICNMRSMRALILFVSLLVASPVLGAQDPVHPHWKVVQAVWAGVVEQIPTDWLVEHHPPAAVGRIDGRLLFGRSMIDSPSVWTRHSHSSWAVPELMYALRSAHAAVQRLHPGGQDLSIGDMSLRRGGRYPPHRTHQSGRDADLRYYIKGVLPDDRERYPVGPSNMDVPRQWAFVQHLYVTGLAELIYMDVRHQKTLYKHATKTLGLTPEQLKPIISYPFGRRRKTALVRHVSGHYNHLHVRASAPIARFFGSLYTRATARQLQRRVAIATTGHFEHVIKQGQTLGWIAREHDVRLVDLMRWNRLNKRSRLSLGQILKVQVELKRN